ncbi:MAG TPA: FAD-linked oxidase C-terminal domain-containing protein, partial [Vicinamibacterales bacterium]|nr:FAD-linked oxidase C-terminal domain-containing protein [Vicinamibacterales bacterium]
ADACTRLLRSAVVPAALEIVDGECLRALAAHLGPAAPGFGEAGSMLLVELDGAEALVAAEAPLVARACREAGATDVAVARTPESRDALWRARRELSPALRTLAPVKINHDIVVPRGRLAEVFALARRLAADHRLCIPCFGHAGDGNIHVNLMFDPGADPDAPARARAAERRLFEEVVRLGGSISGEHGIGFAKAPFLGLELQAETIALMRRIKAAFDPHGILNPGKIFDGGDPAGPA